MKIRSGQHFYGQDIGILVFSSRAPRIAGDPGHAATFAYPVRYGVVKGSFMDLVNGSADIREKILAACRELQGMGIRGVVAVCGLMSLYQKDVGAALMLPFVGSSLCQIPLIWQIIGQCGSIGIITGHSALLQETHLRSSGWREEIPLVVQGMQDEPHFAQVVIEGAAELDIVLMRRDVLRAASLLAAKSSDLRAVILECSNLATYSRDVSDLLGLPVFDAVSAANLLQYGISPPAYC